MFHEKIDYPGNENVYLECYILNCSLRLGQEKKRPAVIVCPGGGYLSISPREGEPVAAAYAAKGFHTFVLHYSVGHDAAGYAPQAQLEWAIRLIREHTDTWRVSPQKVFACGFSAGGHLALSVALFGKEKPDGLILGYPAVSLQSEESAFIARLLAGKKELNEEERKYADLPAHVTKDAPPLFLFTTAEDQLTARPALDLACAYMDQGLPCELHIYQKGAHGYALADLTTADGVGENLNSQFETWLTLSAKWLLDVTGGITLGEPPKFNIMEEMARMAAEY